MISSQNPVYFSWSLDQTKHWDPSFLQADFLWLSRKNWKKTEIPQSITSSSTSFQQQNGFKFNSKINVFLEQNSKVIFIFYSRNVPTLFQWNVEKIMAYIFMFRLQRSSESSEKIPSSKPCWTGFLQNVAACGLMQNAAAFGNERTLMSGNFAWVKSRFCTEEASKAQM